MQVCSFTVFFKTMAKVFAMDLDKEAHSGLRKISKPFYNFQSCRFFRIFSKMSLMEAKISRPVEHLLPDGRLHDAHQ